jgi:hypothetical protein
MVALNHVADYYTFCGWHHTFVRWLGSDQGMRYEQRYFCYVIANLAANRLIAGDLEGCRMAAPTHGPPPGPPRLGV